MSLGPLVRNRIRGQRSHTRAGATLSKHIVEPNAAQATIRVSGRQANDSGIPHSPHTSLSLSLTHSLLFLSGTDCQPPLASGVIGSTSFRPPQLDRDSDSNRTFYSNSDSDSDSSIISIPILTASDLWLAVSLPVGATLHICPQADITYPTQLRGLLAILVKESRYFLF